MNVHPKARPIPARQILNLDVPSLVSYVHCDKVHP